MRKVLAIIIVLVMLIGVGMLAYPLVSSVANNIHYDNEASEYDKTVEAIPDEEIEEMLKLAEDYNTKIAGSKPLDDPFDAVTYEEIDTVYQGVLNVDGDGLIGYIEIPCIDVKLPIKHSTTEEVLSKAAGHLKGSSLPVGGKGTNSVISAHSAYPGITFFDYLTDVKIGDHFYITVLNKKLKYEVDYINVVLPSNTTDFSINKNKDYITLVTCTPYSINTHRLIVRGKRVPYDPDDKVSSSSIKVDDNYIYLFGYRIPYWVMTLIVGIFVLIVVIIIIIVVKRNRENKKREQAKKKKALSENRENQGGQS